MKTPPIPKSEPQRLRALQHYRTILDKSKEMLDSLTALASDITEAPISLVSLVDEDEQFFPSRVGLGVPCTSRDVSFCAHGLEQDKLFTVRDALEDDRFHDNPLVTGDPHIRFYAGAPLRIADGLSLGSLCVIDRKPRELNEVQKNTLMTLARAVVSQLELQRAFKDLDRIEEMLPICAWCRNIKTESGEWQPLHDYVAQTANVTHGLCPECAESELKKLGEVP